MSDSIFVGYDDKLRRLTFKAPFWANDVLRGFPSRRFHPKSKSWHVPLTVQNVNYMNENKHKYDFAVGLLAQQAIDNLHALTAPPVHLDFPPEYFVHQPYPPLEHQWRMLNYGWNLNAYALIAAMGTGKTFVTIALAMARWKYKGLRRLAIISPKNLHNTWKKEFKKWYYNDEDYMISRIASGDHTGLQRWLKEDPHKLHILLIGVEGLGVSEKYVDTVRAFYINSPGPIMTNVDESSRIKNEKAKRTNVAITFGHGVSEWRMILNGTPTAKSFGDLWPQYEFLDPNIIGSGDYWSFRTRYLVYGGYEGKQLVGYQKTEELMDLIRPYTLEVDKSVLNLPPKLYKEISVTPTNEQKAMIRQIIKGKGPYPKIKVQNVLERDLRIQQVIGGNQPVTVVVEKRDGEMVEMTELVPLDENPKFDTLITLIEENVATSKFVIWSRFVPELELIIKSLKEKYGPASTLGYYGAVSEEDRIIAEDRYCNDPTARFFVGNPAAAGLGLTLISGENDVMVYYSGTFAYIDRSQSEDRCHRIGQKNTCLVIDLIMENTLDTTIQESIKEKSDLDKYIKRRVAAGKSIDELLDGDIK